MTSFRTGEDRWLAAVGKVRDAVRQGLVSRQLAAHLATGRSLEVLDVGCGQGTQAIALARLGHRVVGVDTSAEMLRAAVTSASGESGEVRERLLFDLRDALNLDGARYDLVCCHGVAMYLPSLEELVASLVAAARPGGLISLLTRNRFGIAMRAGMEADWARTLAGFDATHYTNRIGVSAARADEPAAVRDVLEAAGASVVAWYGVRLFTDHWGHEEAPTDFDVLLAAEEEAGRRDPYRALAALTHTLARVDREPH